MTQRWHIAPKVGGFLARLTDLHARINFDDAVSGAGDRRIAEKLTDPWKDTSVRTLSRDGVAWRKHQDEMPDRDDAEGAVGLAGRYLCGGQAADRL